MAKKQELTLNPPMNLLYIMIMLGLVTIPVYAILPFAGIIVLVLSMFAFVAALNDNYNQLYKQQQEMLAFVKSVANSKN